jgi:sn-glycerol 3-phosphate transport system substrate-binding protein
VLLKSAPRELKQAAWRFVQFMLRADSAAFWSSETGYLPVTTDAAQLLETSGFYAQHPNHRVALEQLAVAQPWPWSKSLFRIQREVVQPALEAAVLEQREPARAMTEAQKLAQDSQL